jgi:RND family efflux transporter MFP subunit
MARANWFLVITTVFFAAFFSRSTFPALAQTSTETGKELREFPGVVVPALTVAVSPRYNGLLSKIYFLPGQFVEEGDLLFEFRTNDQELAVEIDQSKLQRAEAELRMAELTLKNKRDLRAKKVVSETETLQAEASRDIAAANVVEARLTVQLSESALKNMKLYAPIRGIISSSFVFEGAFITKEAREQSGIALITKLNPIRVIYHIPFEVYAQTAEILKTSDQANQQHEISLVLPNGERFTHTGIIVAGSNEFNRDSQTIDILAEFPNPTYLLRPGLNVTVQTRILPSQN